MQGTLLTALSVRASGTNRTNAQLCADATGDVKGFSCVVLTGITSKEG